MLVCYSSWPGKSAKRVFANVTRPSTSFWFSKGSKSWMPGSSPGMTISMRGEGCRIPEGAIRCCDCAPRESLHPQEIPFADLDAVVAQDAVGDGGMEIEVRQREGGEELLALQRQLVVRPGREGDVAAVGPVELRRFECLHIVDDLGDALAQFLKALLGI